MPARGHFGFKNALLIGLCVVASLWLLRDAWQVPRGQLHYAQGQWVWQRGDVDVAGTLRLHLDLQQYMLVSFVPQQSNHSFPFRTTQWFHLEARHVDQAAGSFAWGGLRRAVIARTEPSHEAVAT